MSIPFICNPKSHRLFDYQKENRKSQISSYTILVAARNQTIQLLMLNILFCDGLVKKGKIPDSKLQSSESTTSCFLEI